MLIYDKVNSAFSSFASLKLALVIQLLKSKRVPTDLLDTLLYRVLTPKIRRLETLELNSEVTHQLSLPYDLNTTGDLVTTVVNILQRCCDNIHMVVGI